MLQVWRLRQRHSQPSITQSGGNLDFNKKAVTPLQVNSSRWQSRGQIFVPSVALDPLKFHRATLLSQPPGDKVASPLLGDLQPS